MGVLEELAKLDEQEGIEAEEPKVEEVEEEEETPEPVKEEPITPEPAKIEPTPEPAKPAPEDNQAWARMRYEAKQAKDRADQLERENEELRKPKVAAPSKEDDFAGYLDHKVETTDERLARVEKLLDEDKRSKQEREEYEGGLRELGALENQYAQKVPEVKDAVNHLKGMISTSLYLLNPGIDPETLTTLTAKEYLKRGVDAFRQGLNPAEVLYQQAVQMGYKKSSPAQETVIPTTRTPSLAKVAENKKKSSGMAAGGGSEGGVLTNETLNKMTNAERSRLTESDWARLETAG